MVTLFLTAFDQQVKQREFSCALASIEANLDFLNHLIAQGHTLLTAHLIDDERRIDLPLVAFDGLPVATALQALQKEWQAILTQP